MAGLKVSNPNEERELHANIGGEWYMIDAGGSIEVDDPIVAACLVEYGATMTAEALARAREAWAKSNRETNALTDSAPAQASAGARARRGGSSSEQAVADPSGTQGGPAPVVEPPVVTPPGTPDPTAYDPMDYTRDEVLEYLGTAEPDEVARVQEIEAGRGDKARKTIVEWTPPAPVTT